MYWKYKEEENMVFCVKNMLTNSYSALEKVLSLRVCKLSGWQTRGVTNFGRVPYLNWGLVDVLSYPNGNQVKYMTTRAEVWGFQKKKKAFLH